MREDPFYGSLLLKHSERALNKVNMHMSIGSALSPGTLFESSAYFFPKTHYGLPFTYDEEKVSKEVFRNCSQKRYSSKDLIVVR